MLAIKCSKPKTCAIVFFFFCIFSFYCLSYLLCFRYPFMFCVFTFYCFLSFVFSLFIALFIFCVFTFYCPFVFYFSFYVLRFYFSLFLLYFVLSLFIDLFIFCVLTFSVLFIFFVFTFSLFQCPFFPWKDLREEIPNCTKDDCFLEDAVWEYARRNLAVLNIFIKVRQDKTEPFY